jgi:AraC-like DNA-binding protein
MQSFHAAFADLAVRIRAATGASLVWKDADPARWGTLPRDLGEHRHPYCLAIKSDPVRLATCCQSDHAAPADAAPRRRVCPFGVAEQVVPAWREGSLLGWCFVGVWTSRAVRSAPPEDAARAEATAELVRRLLLGILNLHPGVAARDDPRLAAARAYILAHLDASLRADDVAAHLDLSTSRFVHWFRAAAGVPYSEELRRRLMARAGELLAGTPDTVTAIGMRLGFASPTSFTAAFVRHYGRPPARWRVAMAGAGA